MRSARGARLHQPVVFVPASQGLPTSESATSRAAQKREESSGSIPLFDAGPETDEIPPFLLVTLGEWGGEEVWGIHVALGSAHVVRNCFARLTQGAAALQPWPN